MSNLQTAAQTYLISQINGASPLDLLIMTYDAALIGCGQRDLSRTTRALGVLRDALDYSYNAEIALGFFRLYQYCGDLARKGEFDEAAIYLRELRDAWQQVRDRYQPAQAAAVPVKVQGAETASHSALGRIAIAG
ncbi:MAG: flagellar export chaperone FliS [Anaerolineae bacterium]